MMILPRFLFLLWKIITTSLGKMKKSEANWCSHDHDEQHLSVQSFINIVQAIKKLNSISRARFNFRRQPILCTSCMETSCKGAAWVANLTNFSFELCYDVFTEDASLFFPYHGARKVKDDQKLKSRGPALTSVVAFSSIFQSNFFRVRGFLICGFRLRRFRVS